MTFTFELDEPGHKGRYKVFKKTNRLSAPRIFLGVIQDNRWLRARGSKVFWEVLYVMPGRRPEMLRFPMTHTRNQAAEAMLKDYYAHGGKR